MLNIISHKENAIKTIMKYDRTHTRMDKLKRLTPSFDEFMEKWRSQSLGKAEQYTKSWSKGLASFYQKTSHIYLSYDPEIPLQEFTQEKLNTHKNIVQECSQKFCL